MPRTMFILQIVFRIFRIHEFAAWANRHVKWQPNKLHGHKYKQSSQHWLERPRFPAPPEPLTDMASTSWRRLNTSKSPARWPGDERQRQRRLHFCSDRRHHPSTLRLESSHQLPAHIRVGGPWYLSSSAPGTNVPVDYDNGAFESCDGDVSEPMCVCAWYQVRIFASKMWIHCDFWRFVQSNKHWLRLDLVLPNHTAPFLK